MTLIEYWICHGTNVSELRIDVQNFCRDGWEPHGSMIVDRSQASTYYIQPVVRRTVGDVR